MQSKLISDSKFLQFKSAQSPNGSEWYYVHRTNDSKSHDSAVVITTLIKNNDSYDFLFLKTQRPPLYAESKASFCLESPAGLIGDVNKEETLIDCTKKELLEEAGLCADKIFIELINSSTSSGLSSETLSYITAIVDNPIEVQAPVDDGGIIVERLKIPSKDIRTYLQNLNPKEISVAAATVCGIFFALERVFSNHC